LLTTLIEKGFNRGLGFEIRTITESGDEGTTIRKDAFLFGESQSRVIVSVGDNQLSDFLRQLEKNKILHARLGTVTDGEIKVDNQSWGSISKWKELYDTAIEKHLTKQLQSEGALEML
jgi:phosphoribosylformylglycinamidine synthase